MYGSVEEGGGRGVASRLQLKGRVCSILTDAGWRLGRRDSGLNIRVRVRVRSFRREGRFRGLNPYVCLVTNVLVPPDIDTARH